MDVPRTRTDRCECQTQRTARSIGRLADSSGKRAVHPDHRQPVMGSNDGSGNRSPRGCDAHRTLEREFARLSGGPLRRGRIRSAQIPCLGHEFRSLPGSKRIGSHPTRRGLSVQGTRSQENVRGTVDGYDLAGHTDLSGQRRSQGRPLRTTTRVRETQASRSRESRKNHRPLDLGTQPERPQGSLAKIGDPGKATRFRQPDRDLRQCLFHED